MSTPNDGGPAFPCLPISNAAGDVQWAGNGMTLRDYFAAAALQGYVACSYDLEVLEDERKKTKGQRYAWPSMVDRAGEIEEAADFCYRMADAMLAERKKGGQ